MYFSSFTQSFLLVFVVVVGDFGWLRPTCVCVCGVGEGGEKGVGARARACVCVCACV